MPVEKYRCNQCKELFELLEPQTLDDLKCPRCASGNVELEIACRVGVGPPPWEYQCKNCGMRFRIEAPRGPDEAAEIKCPVCGNRNIDWLVCVSEACPTGG